MMIRLNKFDNFVYLIEIRRKHSEKYKIHLFCQLFSQI